MLFKRTEKRVCFCWKPIWIYLKLSVVFWCLFFYKNIMLIDKLTFELYFFLHSIHPVWLIISYRKHKVNTRKKLQYNVIFRKKQKNKNGNFTAISKNQIKTPAVAWFFRTKNPNNGSWNIIDSGYRKLIFISF